MQYIVTRYFTDAQDNEYAYHEGDVFPREGLSVSNERISNLMNGNNFQQVQLIKPFAGTVVRKEAAPEEVVEEITAEEINKMPFMKLKSVAKKNGIDVNEKKAADIKAELIERLGL